MNNSKEGLKEFPYKLKEFIPGYGLFSWVGRVRKKCLDVHEDKRRDYWENIGRSEFAIRLYAMTGYHITTTILLAAGLEKILR